MTADEEGTHTATHTYAGKNLPRLSREPDEDVEGFIPHMGKRLP